MRPTPCNHETAFKKSEGFEMINVHLICFQLLNPLGFTPYTLGKTWCSWLSPPLQPPLYQCSAWGMAVLCCVLGRDSAPPMLESPNSCSVSSCCWEDLILELRKAELFTHPFSAFRAGHSPPRGYHPSEYVSQRLFVQHELRTGICKG